ncbi:MAG TPA: hypothetical protein VHE30_08725 [Polyangiaceae bacterium]|nr:hypothetical protein [Polyangiaceae bacterium]
MTPEQKKYLYVQSPIGSAIVNALINGLLGYGATIGLAEFPAWKIPGVAGDFLATAFGVAFGTTLGAILQIKLDSAKGRISPPSFDEGLPARAARTPKGWFARSMLIGLFGLLAFGPSAVLALKISGAEALPRGTFVLWKAVLSAVEGAVVTPFILLATLAHYRAAPKPVV